MANEISLSATLSLSKSGISLSGQSNLSITQSGNNNIGAVQSIPTSSTTIAISGITTPGYVAFKNMSASNFISVGTITPCVAGTAQITLLPGEIAVIPTRLSAWYALADTATVDLLVVFLEL